MSIWWQSKVSKLLRCFCWPFLWLQPRVHQWCLRHLSWKNPGQHPLHGRKLEVPSLLLHWHLWDHLWDPLLQVRSMEGAKRLKVPDVGQFGHKWARMVRRLLSRALWHAWGLLLWLVQRPALRFLPFPYPATTSIMLYEKQVRDMMRNRILSQRHGNFCLIENLCTAQNLQELSQFRNRVGWKVAFLEDPLLDGMLAARSSKGQAAKVRNEVIKEAKAHADRMTQEEERREVARQLIGPKGGLPSLKSDLLRLAALLRVETNAKMTIEELKSLIKPMIETLKGVPSDSSSSKAGYKGRVSKAQPSQKPVAASHQASSSTPPATSTLNAQQIQHMMAMQETKFQSMLSQSMQHMMSMHQNPMSNTTAAEALQHFPEVYRMTQEEEMEMNSLEKAALMEDRLWANYGPELEFMTPEQIRVAKEEMWDVV